MAPLPLIKIFAVVFKEVSKPLAASIKLHAQTHPRARALATTLGRAYETASARLALSLEGNKLATAKPVADSHALSTGAELVAQGFLLASAMGLVLAEYWRSAWTKAAEDARGRRARGGAPARHRDRARGRARRACRARGAARRRGRRRGCGRGRGRWRGL